MLSDKYFYFYRSFWLKMLLEKDLKPVNKNVLFRNFSLENFIKLLILSLYLKS